jgi:hypothetical protein
MRLKRLTAVFFISFFLCVHLSFSQSYSYSDQECLSCHGKPDIAQIMIDGKVRSLFVDPEEWSQDIHHKGQLLCVDCHTLANPYFHFREGFIDVDCARCHPEEAEEYQKNIHLAFAVPSPGKELPLCFHCHTKHHVLLHDDPSSSVHEKNIGETCGSCHAEVMVKGVFTGSSLVKISGHRKGDIAEKFDMRVCISCHYEDSAHGAKRVYKDFCSRCHDVRSMANVVMGPTHLTLPRFSFLNYANSALALSFVIGIFIFFGYRSRKSISNGVKSWLGQMRIDDEEEDIRKEGGKEDKEKGLPEPESPAEHAQEEIKKEEPEQKQESAEGQEPVKEKGEEEPAKEEDTPEEEKEDAAPAREEKPPPEESAEKGEDHILKKEEEEEEPNTEESLQEETEEHGDKENDGQKGTQ